ncbi:MAG: glycosyltransferase family 2 protein, partial [Pyrinomonadaceae bacterium]
PNEIGKLENVFRYVGSGRRAYKAVNIPQPQYRAKSLSIIVNYRDRPELMESFLQTLSRQKTNKTVEVIMINNQSTPENFDHVKKRAAELLPSLFKVIHEIYDAPFNLSWQDNRGAEISTGEVLFFINNDAYFMDTNVLEVLADWAMEPGVATVGPGFYGKAGRLVSSGVEVFPDKRRLHGYVMRECEEPYIAHTIHESAGNSFACAAINKETWLKLGGLNGDVFPDQYNDADLYIRAMMAGYKHIFVGTVRVFHEPGASEQRTREMVFRLHNRLCSIYPDMGKFHGREIFVNNIGIKLPDFAELIPALTLKLINFSSQIDKCRRVR